MTFVIADVVFPAFYFPYLAQLMYPLSAFAALFTECLVFALLNRPRRSSRLLLIVVVANLTSSLAGIAIAAFLGSVFNLNLGKSEDPTHGGHWTALTAATWLGAFAVSIVLEYVVVRAMTRRAPLEYPGFVVIVANVASYFVLLLVFQASVWWSLHQRSASGSEESSVTPVGSGLAALAADARR